MTGATGYIGAVIATKLQAAGHTVVGLAKSEASAASLRGRNASRSISRGEQMAKKLINPERLYDGTPFGMSQAVLDTESSLVFVSGQVDWDRQYQVSQNSVLDQFEAALENLRTALVAAGASVDSLLHLRLYVRGELEDHMESLAPILAKFLGSSRPAVTGIGVASLASKATLVEVEAVARAD